MSRRNIGMLGLVIAALFIVLTPIGGCAAIAPLTGKPDKVVIYHLGDLSGPYGAFTAPVVSSIEDFTEWFNTEGGGIDGVPIANMFRDTEGDLDTALEAYAALKASRPYPIVDVIYDSAGCETLRRLHREDGILCFTNCASGDCIYPAGYTFSTIPSYPDSIGAFIDWVTEDWAKKTGQEVKLAILTWDNVFGRGVMVDAVRNYAAQKGVEIVYEGVFDIDDMDVSTQMAAIKNAGANWVYDNTLAYGPKVVSEAAASLGMLNQDLYDTTPGMIHRACGPWGMDDLAVAQAGELAEGVIGARSFASWSMPEVEGVAAAVAAFYKHDRKPEERTLSYLAEWAELYTVCYAMNKAVEEVGWDELSGITLRDQFLNLEDFCPQGMTRYTFTARKPEPTQTLIFKVERGRLLPITDWVTCPDLRPAAVK